MFLHQGAAKMVLDTKQHPEALKDEVQSPGGTSAHAVSTHSVPSCTHTALSTQLHSCSTHSVPSCTHAVLTQYPAALTQYSLSTQLHSRSTHFVPDMYLSSTHKVPTFCVLQ